MPSARGAALTAVALVLTVTAIACARAPAPVEAGAQTWRTAPARRIVAIPPNLAYSYATVDGSIAHFAGLRPDVPGRIERLLLGRVFPGISRVPRVGGVEEILRTRPDAVFDWVYVDHEVELMRAVGLPVVTFANGDTAFTAWPSSEGRIAGKAARATELLRAYAASERAVVRARGEPPRGRPVRVLLFATVAPRIVGVAMPHACAIAGVRGLVASRAVLGLEAVAAMDPDIVLLFGDDATPADLFTSPRWSAVRAVRERRVYEIPEEWPGFDGLLDEPLFARWLAELAYPERMPRSLRAEIRRTYAMTFGYRVSDVDLDRALRLHDDAASAGYVARFGASP